MSVLSKPYFHDETAAIEKLESILWPNGPVCPHCGGNERIYELNGKSTRPGLRKCGACRKQFTVKVGTVFESSHVPLYKWFQAAYLMTSSKKGISAHQLHRTLEVTYKTAWFMCHRLREAMRDDAPIPMGGEGSVVEADETYFGKKPGMKKPKGARGPVAHRAVISLVERGGSARSFHADSYPHAGMVREILVKNVRRESELNTDESGLYKSVGKEFNGHYTVVHSQYQYVHPQTGAHSNTVEGYFSIFKRGMKGVYQHCSERHLRRYLAEFDFRYSNREAVGVNDAQRLENALRGISGKRLTYEGPNEQAHH